MNSKFKKIGNVVFPAFVEAKHYMVPHKVGSTLPTSLRVWKETLAGMLAGIEDGVTVFLTIDSKRVEAGLTQRNSGAHIDGNWDGVIKAWSTPGGGGWKYKDLSCGGLIIASNCCGTKLYSGEVEGSAGKGGSCGHLDLSQLECEQAEDGKAYLGNVSMIHSGVAMSEDTERQLVRITLPSDYKIAI
tara:strand:- start:12 stop:572 length:561 start_codon:yes stop_codon:yes gene_type:complete